MTNLLQNLRFLLQYTLRCNGTALSDWARATPAKAAEAGRGTSQPLAEHSMRMSDDLPATGRELCQKQTVTGLTRVGQPAKTANPAAGAGLRLLHHESHIVKPAEAAAPSTISKVESAFFAYFAHDFHAYISCI